MYKVNHNEHVILFDCDDTLVSLDPIPGVVPIEYEGGKYYPIQETIEKLKNSYYRGHLVRVHSQGGVEWAEKVVKVLKLQDFVDEIETKPRWYYDDLPADVWMHRFDVRKYKREDQK